MAVKRVGRKGQGTVEYAGSLVIAAVVVAGVLSVAPTAVSAIFEALLETVQNHFATQI